MPSATPASLVREHALSGGAKAIVTAPSLDAVIATCIGVYALKSSLPEIPGELEVLLEWMQRGTKHHSREALGNAFGALGITPVLTSMNGGVTFVLQCLDACREPALQLARELLYEPLFDEDELQNVLQEFDEDDRSCTDDPGEITSRAQLRARWSGTMLSAPANGTVRTRRQLTPAYLKALHAKIFTQPSLVGIGTSYPDAWLRDTERWLLQDRPARRFDYRPAERAVLPAKPRDLVVNVPTMEHAAVLRFCPGPSGTMRELAAAKLHHEALTDGMSAPLMAELRGQLALSYSVSSGLVDRNDMWDQLYEVEPEPARVEAALEAAEALWQRKDLLAEEDIRRGRAQIAMSTRLRSIDASSVILTAMREDLLRGRPLDWRDTFADELQQVGTEEAIAAAQRYGLSQPAICTIIVGPVKQLPKTYRSDAMDLKTLFEGWTLD